MDLPGLCVGSCKRSLTAHAHRASSRADWQILGGNIYLPTILGLAAVAGVAACTVFSAMKTQLWRLVGIFLPPASVGF